MIISYSELTRWDTCRMQYHYGHMEKLVPLEVSEPIATGNAGHALLQKFYSLLGDNFNIKDAVKQVNDTANTLLLSNKFGATGTPLLTAWVMVQNYIQSTEFKAEAVIVENRFLFPLSDLTDIPEASEIQIGFTPDVVFKRTGGFCDVEDSKFVGRAWSESKIKRFQQAKLYQIFLQRMGYNISRSQIRFFNTKTTKISVVPFELKAAEEKTLTREFVDACLEVAEYRNNPNRLTRRTMNNNTCQGCFYEHICTLEAQGIDATWAKRSMFMKSDYDYSV
jgi:CRISPR/Cas system-associated exonuclease Cas4 (RecB family)